MPELSFVRTRQYIGQTPFVVDQHTAVRDTGRQIDWDLLDETFSENPQKITTNGAAAKGATSVTVQPLPTDLEIGDILKFGEYDPVTVTASAALAAATSIGVTALSGPIPTGTVLDFGTNKFARLTAAAAAGDVSITVSAIPTALAGAEVATFKGGEIVAVVDVAAQAGDTTIATEELPFGIPTASVAVIPGEIAWEIQGGRHVKAGTVVDLLANGKVVPSSLNSGGGVTAYGILVTNADEGSKTDAATGYGVFTSGSFYENLLPDQSAGSISSTWKTELLNRGGWWLFQAYGDDTV